MSILYLQFSERPKNEVNLNLTESFREAQTMVLNGVCVTRSRYYPSLYRW